MISPNKGSAGVLPNGTMHFSDVLSDVGVLGVETLLTRFEERLGVVVIPDLSAGAPRLLLFMMMM